MSALPRKMCYHPCFVFWTFYLPFNVVLVSHNAVWSRYTHHLPTAGPPCAHDLVCVWAPSSIGRVRRKAPLPKDWILFFLTFRMVCGGWSGTMRQGPP